MDGIIPLVMQQTVYANTSMANTSQVFFIQKLNEYFRNSINKPISEEANKYIEVWAVNENLVLNTYL